MAIDNRIALALGCVAAVIAATALRVLLDVVASVCETVAITTTCGQLAKKMAGCAVLGMLAGGLAAAGGWLVFCDGFWSTLFTDATVGVR